MQTVRTTISLPAALVAEFQKLVGEDKSFSEQIRLAMLSYIEREQHIHLIREMEATYKKHSRTFAESAKEHEDFREHQTNYITSSL